MPFHEALDQTSAAPGRYSATVVLRLLAVASVVLPLSIVVITGITRWQAEHREAWTTNDRLASLMQLNIVRLLQTQLMVLEEVASMAEWLDEPPEGAEREAIIGRLMRMRAHMPHLREICVISPSGRVILDTGGIAPAGTDLSKQEFIRHFSAGDTTPYVSRPFEIEGQGTVIVVAARRVDRGGAYAGVVLSVIDQGYIAEMFRRAIDTYTDSAGRTMTLRRADGALLARVPNDPATEQSAAAAAAMARGAAPMGRLVRRAGPDEQGVLVTWSRVPDLNLSVVSCVTRAAIMHAWLSGMLPHLYFGLPSSVCLFVIILFAMHRQKQIDEERQRRHDAEEAYRQGQKMEALGKLTGGLAHDFNNLLAVIMGSAELARGRSGAVVDRSLDTILHASRRASRLTRQLLSFSRTQAVIPKVVSLQAEGERLRDILRPALGGNILLSVVVPDDTWPVEMDPDEWEIALLNIAVNARDAMPDGGQFAMTATNLDLGPGDVPGTPGLAGAYVRVDLRDSGGGMTPEVMARAFEPFFTTKETGRGTGLGLSQVYGFARQSGGGVTVESDGRTGTRISLYLPRSHTPASAPAPAPAPAAGAPDPAMPEAAIFASASDN